MKDTLIFVLVLGGFGILGTALVFIFRELGRLSERMRLWENSLAELRDRLSALSPMEECVKELNQEVLSLSRLFTGRASGRGGERILNELLAALPPEILLREVEMGSGRVEFALRLRNGHLVPLDSKFVEPASLNHRNLSSRVLARARELQKYLEDPRCAGFALAAVPDGVYEAVRKELARAALEHRVVLVPYTQILPVVLMVIAMAPKFSPEGSENGEELDLFFDELERNLVQQEKLLRQGLQKIGKLINLILKKKTILVGR